MEGAAGAEPEPELEPAPGVDDAEDDAQNMMKVRGPAPARPAVAASPR